MPPALTVVPVALVLAVAMMFADAAAIDPMDRAPVTSSVVPIVQPADSANETREFVNDSAPAELIATKVVAPGAAVGRVNVHPEESDVSGLIVIAAEEVVSTLRSRIVPQSINPTLLVSCQNEYALVAEV